MTSPDQTAKIRTLNDAFREEMTAMIGVWIGSGQLVITAGIAARGNGFIDRAVSAVRRFSAFTPDNDPWGEHDFGMFDLEGERLNWKIDYDDLRMADGSADPSDETTTRRVLTILLAEEY